MGFHTLATACRKGIKADETTLQFVSPFANGHPAPPEFAFRAALSPGAQFFDGAGDKQPSGTALERLCCLDEQRLERVREFHGTSSRKDVPGVYHRSGLVLFSRVPYRSVCSLLRSPSTPQTRWRSARRCDISHRNSGSRAGC